MPEDVAKHYPAEHRDADGLFASFRIWLCVIGYNTNLVKPEDAPKSFADLLDPKWVGKIVKAHPGYSGTIMTATFQIARDLGWDYLEKLAKQKVMQVQSATDPPKKLALGERAVMADGNEYNLFQLKETGEPVEIVYPTEGTPLDRRPERHLQERAQSERRAAVPELLLRLECQQLIIGCRRPALGASAGQGESRAASRFASIKTMKDDPAGVEKHERGDQDALQQAVRGVTAQDFVLVSGGDNDKN